MASLAVKKFNVMIQACKDVPKHQGPPGSKGVFLPFDKGRSMPEVISDLVGIFLAYQYLVLPMAAPKVVDGWPKSKARPPQVLKPS